LRSDKKTVFFVVACDPHRILQLSITLLCCKYLCFSCRESYEKTRGKYMTELFALNEGNNEIPAEVILNTTWPLSHTYKHL
jgi:hypothetical protein